MGVETYANNAQTTLSSAITSSQTTIPVISATPFPATSSIDFYRVIIDGEIMLVTGGQGTLTWTVTRGVENTATAAHASGSVVTGLITVQGLRELQWKDKANRGTSTGHILDDEFDDGVLDAAWTRVDNAAESANVTWAEGADVLSVKNVGTDAAARYHALLKPLGSLTFPITIEYASRRLTRYAVNYVMFGAGFTDGTTYNTGSQIFSRDYTHSGIATSLLVSYTGETGFNAEPQQAGYENVQVIGGLFYNRVIWSAANTFQFWISPDGVSWIQTFTNVSYTMTPTHFGFFISHWGTVQNSISSVEYVRIFESNKAGNI